MRYGIMPSADLAAPAPATEPGADVAGAPVLELRGLRTVFETEAGEVRAVDDVSFSVREAEVLAVVGESGSGKSVTALSVMRLLGRAGGRIAAGEIWLIGRDGRRRDLARLSEPEMAALRGREIAMIFQDPGASLNPVFTIGDQVAEPLRLHQDLGRTEARAAAVNLLRLVGIADPETRVDAYPHQLSGGMRQRAMIATALACGPRLLIADEPTTALDVTVQAQVVALLRGLQAERRMAMIFVTHDLHLVADVADRVAVMYAGQVVEEGPAAGLLSRPLHPYTRALLECVPRRRPGELRSRRLRPIPGTMPSPLAPPPACRFAPRCPHAQARCVAGPPPLEQASAERATRCVRWREIAP
jgi:oligopeptide/dipeptide ABC transporter ATP-binding protein